MALAKHELLLRACATTRVDEASRRAVSGLLGTPGMDWAGLVNLSVRHGMAQLVAIHLQDFAGDVRLPPEVSACFARMYRANGHRNEVLFRETAQLLRAFEVAQIPCLVLKGVGLALTAYPDPALRHFSDIDLLVPATRFDAACQITETGEFSRDEESEEAGHHHVTYVRSCPEDILTETLAPEFDPSLTPEILARYRHQVKVEIHRGVFRHTSGSMRKVDMTPFWERPQPARLPDGTPIYLPAPEAMLVHLSDHAAHHLFERLIFPVDVVQVIRQGGRRIDWERVIYLASYYKVQDPVYQMLALVQREFGVEVPVEGKWAKGQVGSRQRGNPKSEITLPEIFASSRIEREHGFETWQRWRTWRRWFLSRNLWERVLSLWQTVFPSPSAMRRIYGVKSPLLITALYFVRPFQVMRRLVRVLFHLMSNEKSAGAGRSL